MALCIQPRLAPRLNKQYTYTTAPPLCLHTRWHYIFVYYLPHFSSPAQKFMCTIISSESDRMWFTWKAKCGTIEFHMLKCTCLGDLEVYEICFNFCQSVSFYINATENQCISRPPTFCVCKYVQRRLVWLRGWEISPLQILFLQLTKQLKKSADMCKLPKCDMNPVLISRWQKTIPTLDNVATVTGRIVY